MTYKPVAAQQSIENVWFFTDDTFNTDTIEKWYPEMNVNPLASHLTSTENQASFFPTSNTEYKWGVCLSVCVCIFLRYTVNQKTKSDITRSWMHSTKLWREKNLSLKINISPPTINRKEQKMTTSVCLLVHGSPILLLAKEEHGQNPISNGHAVHKITRALTRHPVEQVSIHLSVAGFQEDKLGDIHRSKKDRRLSIHKSLQPRLDDPGFPPSLSLALPLPLSHIVVLVWVLLVTLHIVPVNERLYSLLQVSRLHWKL